MLLKTMYHVFGETITRHHLEHQPSKVHRMVLGRARNQRPVHGISHRIISNIEAGLYRYVEAQNPLQAWNYSTSIQPLTVAKPKD